MKTNLAMVCLVLLFLSPLTAQIKQTPATFKNESLAKFLSEDILSRIKDIDVPNGKVTVSFTITKDGEVVDPFPENFKERILALNALLAVQATSKLWNPTLSNGVAIDKKYKIFFNFIEDVEKVELEFQGIEAYMNSGKYKKVLRLLERNNLQYSNSSTYFSKRAEVKKKLNDYVGFKKDSIKAQELKNEVLGELTIITKGKIKRVVSIGVVETKDVIRNQN
ncbi:hypothetical protein [Polaribacter pacificus]|nr:hypothetical protein [Polaribacter pacificus]